MVHQVRVDVASGVVQDHRAGALRDPDEILDRRGLDDTARGGIVGHDGHQQWAEARSDARGLIGSQGAHSQQDERQRPPGR